MQQSAGAIIFRPLIPSTHQKSSRSHRQTIAVHLEQIRKIQCTMLRVPGSFHPFCSSPKPVLVLQIGFVLPNDNERKLDGTFEFEPGEVCP